MPRHKTIPDSQVLEALLEALMQTGPANLTFRHASDVCGLSSAALIQRYGNREALVHTILMHAWDRLDAETELADAEEALTAEGAIRLLLRLMPSETAERNATDGLLLLREDIRDPVLRARGAAWGERLARALGRRVAKDSETEKRLGWQMASVWQGAHTWWAFTQKEPADRAIRRQLEDWIDWVK